MGQAASVQRREPEGLQHRCNTAFPALLKGRVTLGVLSPLTAP